MNSDESTSARYRKARQRTTEATERAERLLTDEALTELEAAALDERRALGELLGILDDDIRRHMH